MDWTMTLTALSAFGATAAALAAAWQAYETRKQASESKGQGDMAVNMEILWGNFDKYLRESFLKKNPFTGPSDSFPTRGFPKTRSQKGTSSNLTIYNLGRRWSALDTEQLRMVVSIQPHSQESEEQGNIMKQRVLLQQTSVVNVIAHSPAANALHGAQ
jgi:hypothetical protein